MSCAAVYWSSSHIYTRRPFLRCSTGRLCMSRFFNRLFLPLTASQTHSALYARMIGEGRVLGHRTFTMSVSLYRPSRYPPHLCLGLYTFTCYQLPSDDEVRALNDLSRVAASRPQCYCHYAGNSRLIRGVVRPLVDESRYAPQRTVMEEIG